MDRSFDEIKRVLNENIKSSGLNGSGISRILCKEFPEFSVDFKYKGGFVDTSKSIIYDGNSGASIDNFVGLLSDVGIIVRKRLNDKKYSGVNILRYFTNDYEEYQKLKKRKKVIDVVLKKDIG